MKTELKDYIEQFLEIVADECNVKQVILEHPYAVCVYSFDTIGKKTIEIDDEWPLWSMVLSGGILEDMKIVRGLVGEGLKQRSKAKIGVRQPLQSITIKIGFEK